MRKTAAKMRWSRHAIDQPRRAASSATLRAMRQMKKLRLEDVQARGGPTISYLSRLENGHGALGVNARDRLSLVYNVSRPRIEAAWMATRDVQHWQESPPPMTRLAGKMLLSMDLQKKRRKA